VIRALQDLHGTVLPNDPPMYGILSEADMDMLAQLCRELRELLGAEFDEQLPSSSKVSAEPAIVELPPNVDPAPTSIAGKE
jgi:hypothetical protein